MKNIWIIYMYLVFVLASSAILQGGVFGLSSMFPSQYTQAVMGGMVCV